MDKIKSIEFRTKWFPYILGLFSIISIILFVNLILSQEEKDMIVAKKDRATLDHLQISARSAFVWDMMKSEVIYEKNANEPLPLASVTKVMTALVAEEAVLKSEPQNVLINSKDIETDGDSGLFANTIWNLQSIIDYSLVVSSNDGASAIANSLGTNKENFIAEMNRKGQKIGLLDSKFINEHGLDKDVEHVGAYGSARDMAILFEYIIRNYPSLLEATKYQNLTFRDMGGVSYKALNTNVAAGLVPSLIASKTGYTDLAGGNIVIAFDAEINHPVIIAVLGSTREARFSDMLALVNASMKYLQQ